MNDPERKQAWRQARAAVRAYSRNPSESNAAHVEVAWREIRRMDGVSFWRAWQASVDSDDNRRQFRGGRFSDPPKLKPRRIRRGFVFWPSLSCAARRH